MCSALKCLLATLSLDLLLLLLETEGCWEPTAGATFKVRLQARCTAGVPWVPYIFDLHGVLQAPYPDTTCCLQCLLPCWVCTAGLADTLKYSSGSCTWDASWGMTGSSQAGFGPHHRTRSHRKPQAPMLLEPPGLPTFTITLSWKYIMMRKSKSNPTPCRTGKPRTGSRSGWT